MIAGSILSGIIAATLCVTTPEAHAAQGDLQVGFGVDGLAVMNVGATALAATSIDQIEPTTAGRYFVVATAPTSGHVVMRYLPNSTPDTTWNGGAPLTLEPNGHLAVFDDGSVLWVAQAWAAKYEQDGTPASGWGVGGIAYARFGYDTTLVETSRTFPDGTFVLGGRVYQNSGLRAAVFRFLSDGSADPSFGTDGVWLGAADITGPMVSSVTPTAGGLLVTVDGLNVRQLMRLTAAGATDPTYGTGGTVALSQGECVALDQLGRAIRVTGIPLSLPARISVGRLTSGGAPDATFGTAGTASIPWPEGDSGTGCTEVAVVGDRLYVPHRTNVAGATTALVSAVNLTTGALDSTFGTTGHVEIATAVAPEVVIPSSVSNRGGGALLALLRTGVSSIELTLRAFAPTGAPDASFSTDGWTPLSMARHRRLDATSVARAADGTLWVLSEADSAGLSVGHFDADGGAMGVDGATALTVTPPPTTHLAAGNVVPLPDGRVAFSYQVSTAVTTEYRLRVLLADGTPDPTFAGGASATLPYLWIAAGGTPASPVLVSSRVGSANSVWALRVQKVDLQTGAAVPSFGTSGLATIGAPIGASFAAVAVAPDGSIVWATDSTVADAAAAEPTFARIGRLQQDGTVDTLFGTGGTVMVTTPRHERTARFLRLELLGDSRIVVTGGATPNLVGAPDNTIVAARLSASGALDSSYGNSGVVTLPSNAVAADITDDAITYLARTGLHSRGVDLLRLGDDGAADESYGIGGNHPTVIDGAVATSTPSVVDVGTGVIVSMAASSEVVADEIAGHDPALAMIELAGPTYAAMPTSRTPARALDTRPTGVTADGENQGGGKRMAGSTTTLRIAGRLQVPRGATAAILNMTVVQPEANGYLTAYPCGDPRPNASSMNFIAGQVVANEVIVRLPQSGTAIGAVCIFSSAATHLIADVVGHFSPGSSYRAMTPARIVDTRAGGFTIDGLGPKGILAMSGVVEITVAGRGGVADGAPSVTVNVGAVNPSGRGYLTIYPCDSPRPVASSLNYVAGQTIANELIVRLPTSGASAGKLCVYSSAPTHLIVDVVGAMPLSSAFTPLVPARYLDTRSDGTTFDGLDRAGGLADPGSVYELMVAGRGGVPAGASAVVLNVTVVGGTTGWVTVHPCGVTTPTASTVNLAAGRAVANEVVVALPTSGAAAGKVCIFTSSTTHVIADVVGAFAV